MNGEQLLSEASIDAMFRECSMVEPEDFYPTQQLTNPDWMTYGLAWFQADYEGRRVDFHTGSIDGLVAIHGLIRDEEIGVIVLAKRDHVELRHALMYRVLPLLPGSAARLERRAPGALRRARRAGRGRTTALPRLSYRRHHAQSRAERLRRGLRGRALRHGRGGE